MKRILLTCLMAAGGLSAQADGYAYLTFETTDGARVSVPASSLTLSVSGTTLTAGSQQFTLTNLSKMYFSTADETTTGIDTLDADLQDEATEVYSLQGHRVAKSEMRSGVYIVKTPKGTHKIAVR